MGEREPTVRSRELGAALRAALKQARLTAKEVANKLEWSPSEVSRMLSGKRTVRESDAATLLGFCGVGGKEHARVIELCHEGESESWWREITSCETTPVRTYTDQVDNAIRVQACETRLVPGNLQIAPYARAVISSSPNVPREEVDARLAWRLARAEALTKPQAADFVVFLHEFTLRLPVVDDAVMSEQLHHLLRMSVRRNITLRVIPMSAGSHPGHSGSFRLVEFADARPLVYFETESETFFLERPHGIAAHRRVLTALAAASLDDVESRRLISGLAVDLYGSEATLADLLS